MMNFENHFSQEDKKKERMKERVYREVFQDIFDSEDYGFNFETNKKFQRVIDETDVSSEDMQLYVLKRFQQDEGALPGKLGERYAKLVFSIEGIQAMMAGGLDFYEAIAQLSRDIEAKGIMLDKELINNRVDTLKKVLENREAA